MPQFVAYLHEKEAVEKCREWKDQRDFLVKIGAKFNGL